MPNLVQTILVPAFKSIPFEAIAYANLLSKSYEKPLSLLCVEKSLYDELRLLDYPVTFIEDTYVNALKQAVVAQDCVAVVFEHQGKARSILRQLKASRDWRIPYFFVPKGLTHKAPKQVILPVGFLIEEREKATWARSLHRYFASHFVILKPMDKGTRASKNVEHISQLLLKLNISYRVEQSRASSFRLNKDALHRYGVASDLILITASREYGLDDVFLGPQELRVIKKSKIPLMVLNPRDDLYILCGD